MPVNGVMVYTYVQNPGIFANIDNWTNDFKPSVVLIHFLS